MASSMLRSLCRVRLGECPLKESFDGISQSLVGWKKKGRKDAWEAVPGEAGDAVFIVNILRASVIHVSVSSF